MSSLSSLSSSDEEIHRNRCRNIPDRIDLFNKYEGEDFQNRFRITKDTAIQLLNSLGDMEPVTRRNKSIDGMNQLLICLRFFATGTFQRVLGDTANIDKATICRIIQKVSHKIASLSTEKIKMPTRNELPSVAEGFYDIAGFPRVAGSLDCTLIKIESRGGRLAEVYRCRKGYFALNVQAVCDAKLKIRDLIARWPGSVHDCTIFNNSHLCANFQRGLYHPYFLLGDSGYYCKQYLLTPFTNPSTRAEIAYNDAQVATRNPIERCFGTWKKRFPCLSKGFTLRKTSTITATIVATAVLHNICIELNEVLPPDVTDNENEFEEPLAAELAVSGRANEDTSVRTVIVNTVFSL